MKKVLSVLLVLAMVFGLAACGGKKNEDTVKAMTYQEYMAAAEEAKVVVEGYLQGYAYSSQYNNVSMFIQDDNGAYYAYRADCTAEQAKSLAEGAHVRVTGNKGSFRGEIEVQEHCTFEVLSGTKVYPAADVTASLADNAALQAKMNQKVAVKGLVVENIYDGDGKGASFLYNWDGSGQAGANNDVYFNASSNGKTYNFVVESDEFAEGSDTYKAATALKVGDVIDIEAFMYWYDGPNMHVSKFTTTKASKTAAKSAGTMSYAEYASAAVDAPVVIEGYVQGITAYNAQYNNFNVYLADEEGSYYAYGVAASQEDYNKITKGALLKIKGFKGAYHDMPEVAQGAAFELLDGYYVAPVVNATDKLGDTEAMKSIIASKVLLKGLTVVASKVQDDPADYPFLYNWNGTGSAGSNSDVYFKVAAADGKEYSIVVESDEQPEGSEVYTAATGLNIGDQIDLTCFIYWYDAPDLHAQSITLLRK